MWLILNGKMNAASNLASTVTAMMPATIMAVLLNMELYSRTGAKIFYSKTAVVNAATGIVNYLAQN